MDLREGDESVTECLYACFHKGARKKYEEFLSDVDNKVWKEMSEEWQQYLMGKEESPAMSSKDVPNSAAESSRQTPGLMLWKSKEVPAPQPAGSCD